MAKSLHTNDYYAFCKALVEARERAGRTQAEIAAKLRRPQSFVSKYESGERRLDVVEFIQICRAIGVDPAAIFRRISARRRG